MAKSVNVKFGTPNPVRLSYCNVVKPRAAFDGQAPKYSCVLLIPKEDKQTVNALNKAIKECFESNASMFKGYDLVDINPVRDGDGKSPKGKKYPDEYKGHFVLNTSSNAEHKPVLHDKNGADIMDESDIYSGCWAKVGVNFYAYSGQATGIGVGLNIIKKMKDDASFSGASTNEEDYFGSDDDDEI